jgi:hypothetical protein
MMSPCQNTNPKKTIDLNCETYHVLAKCNKCYDIYQQKIHKIILILCEHAIIFLNFLNLITYYYLCRYILSNR